MKGKSTGPRWLAFAALSLLSGCAAISGYPADPEDEGKVLASLKPYFDPAKDSEYAKQSDVNARRSERDSIVLGRLRAYDLEFALYERSLWSTGNSVTLGGDLVALALGGLATTASSTATKTAYSAASTGVVGANAAISRDLYFQRTLPALLTQMESNREKVKVKILAGLKQVDADYSLPAAELDLVDLKSAGSMPSAVSNITQQASNDKAKSDSIIDSFRTGNMSSSSTSARLRNWVSPSGVVNATNMQALQHWMISDKQDSSLGGLPPEIFIDLDNSQLESDRARAINELMIP